MEEPLVFVRVERFLFLVPTVTRECGASPLRGELRSPLTGRRAGLGDDNRDMG
jgi:hypothetical protein